MHPIVKIRSGYGSAKLIVNGEEVDFPSVDEIDDTFDNGESVDLDEMLKTFAEDKNLLMLCGDKKLTDKNINDLADWFRPYWSSIDDVLCIDED